jgi:hypothetical protein
MHRVFVSTPLDVNLAPWQRKVKKKILDAMTAAGLDPQIFGVRGIPLKESWSFESVEEVMDHCSAAAIIAFARYRFPGALPENAFSSEYNHYEGALALSKKLPILILAEEGVSARGVIDRGGGKFIVRIPQDPKPAWIKSADFKPYFDEWANHVKERRDVFFGYCSAAQATADAIIKFMRDTLKLTVEDWAVDFDPGPSILQRINEASERCQTGIFLFTKDDKFADEKGKKKKAAPRDNVIFETGYFMQAKGPERVLIIREDGTKIPADLEGSIYAALPEQKKIAPIHEPLRKFFKAALKRPNL